MPTPSKTPTRTTRSPARKPATQTSLLPSLAVPDGRPTQHNGVAVVQEILRSNLPNNAPMKISKLKLADGTMAAACRDCKFTGDTITIVMQHRYKDHGAGYSKKFVRAHFPADKFVGDIVLPSRGPDKPMPTGAMDMTMAEILALLPSIHALGELIDKTEAQRDLLLAELNERSKHDRENQHKIAAYDSLTDEVVERRAAMRTTGSYEQMRAEVLELRKWKKDMIKKLGPLGFNFNDEES